MDWAWGSPQLVSQVSRFKPIGLLVIEQDERNGLQREVWNARRTARSHLGGTRPREEHSAETATSNAVFTIEQRDALRLTVEF
jgi:hypothetical protein